MESISYKKFDHFALESKEKNMNLVKGSGLVFSFDDTFDRFEQSNRHFYWRTTIHEWK